MPRPRNPVPSYRLHKRSGQARVTLYDAVGRPTEKHLPGPYGSDESRAAYARLVAEYQSSGPTLLARQRPDIAVVDLLLAYRTHVEAHSSAKELGEIRLSLRVARTLYGTALVTDFGPLALKACRQAMVDAGLSRGVVNQRVGRIVRMFKWGVGEELVPPAVYHALAAVTGLRRGQARDTEKVKPVPPAHVDAVRPFVTRHVWGMIETQRLTGMRPGEACVIRMAEVDTSDAVWVFRPDRHKTAWRGRDRVIAIGPKAQRVLTAFITDDPDDYLFSPRRARAEWVKAKGWRTNGPVPEQFGDYYTVAVYGGAVARACRRAGVPGWAPNRLRHLHATATRKRYGLEAAGASLGHSRLSVTEVYAEKNFELARQIALETG